MIFFDQLEITRQDEVAIKKQIKEDQFDLDKFEEVIDNFNIVFDYLKNNEPTVQFFHIVNDKNLLSESIGLTLPNKYNNYDMTNFNIDDLRFHLEEEEKSVFEKFINWLLTWINKGIGIFKGLFGKINYIFKRLKLIKENIDRYMGFKEKKKLHTPMLNSYTIMSLEEVIEKLEKTVACAKKLSVYKAAYVNALSTGNHSEGTMLLYKELDELLTGRGWESFVELIHEIDEVLPMKVVIVDAAENKKANYKENKLSKDRNYPSQFPSGFKIKYVNALRSKKDDAKIYRNDYTVRTAKLKYKKYGYTLVMVLKVFPKLYSLTEELVKINESTNKGLIGYGMYVKKLAKTPDNTIKDNMMRQLITLPTVIDDLNKYLITYYSRLSVHLVKIIESYDSANREKWEAKNTEDEENAIKENIKEDVEKIKSI